MGQNIRNVLPGGHIANRVVRKVGVAAPSVLFGQRASSLGQRWFSGLDGQSLSQIPVDHTGTN